MSKSRTPCFFCGEVGRKRTGEHVFRDKWKQYYGADMTDLRQWGWRAEGSQMVPYDRPYRARPFSQTLNEVCDQCNGGWMNDLENAVEADLHAMFEGQRLELTPQTTTQIIRWAAKTAFVIDGLDERKRTAVTQEQKDALRNGSVPKDVMLWILPLPPMSATVHFRSTPMRVPGQGDDLVPFRITSVDFRSLHFLLTHTTSHTVAEQYTFRWLFGKAVGDQTEKWLCPPPPTVVRPDVLSDYHDGLLQNLFALAAENGIELRINE